MDDLIARLEAATGPCRELDAAIAVASGQYFADRHRPGHFYAADDPTRSGYGIPAYTASIDAALTLVLDRSPKAIFDVLRGAAMLWTQSASTDIADLPRFICIAALRAKAKT